MTIQTDISAFGLCSKWNLRLASSFDWGPWWERPCKTQITRLYWTSPLNTAVESKKTNFAQTVFKLKMFEEISHTWFFTTTVPHKRCNRGDNKERADRAKYWSKYSTSTFRCSRNTVDLAAENQANQQDALKSHIVSLFPKLNQVAPWGLRTCSQVLSTLEVYAKIII